MKIQRVPARRLLEEIRKGMLSVEQLTRISLDGIEKTNSPDSLNAVAEIAPDALFRAREMDARLRAGSPEALFAKFPLFGLPVLVKDNIDVAGLHTAAGSLALAENLASADAPVVASLRQKGALLIGKTNMTEFANYTSQGMPNGYSSRGGQVYGAYRRDGDASGSSTGSAVAVSAGLCPAALGTDTSFSIVGCAAVHGVVGIKPPAGALSGSGVVPISHTLDSVGPLACNLPDALLLYSAMRPQPLPPLMPADKRRLRIGVNLFNRELVSDNQMALYETLLNRLKASGASVSEVSHAYAPGMRDIMRCEFRHDLEQYLASSSAPRKTLAEIIRFYEAVPEMRMPYGISCLREAMENASGMLDDLPYLAALEEREILRRALCGELAAYDACLMTGPTNVFHFAGLPSLTLPLGMGADGCPRGVILYGAEETRLFRAALAVESCCEPVDPPPIGTLSEGTLYEACG